MNLFKTYLLINTILCVLVSCGTSENQIIDEPRKPNELNLNFQDNILELNPILSSNSAEKYISQLIFDPFLKSDLSSELFENFSYDSLNSSYQFYINRNKKFHDGSPVNTESIRTFLKYLLVYHFDKPSVYNLFSSLDGFALVNWYRENRNIMDSIPRGFHSLTDFSFELQLKKNSEELPNWLMTKEYQLFKMNNDQFIGSGDFRLASLNEDISAQLINVRNTGEGIQKVNLSFLKNYELVYSEFNRGKIDLIRYNSVNSNSKSQDKLQEIIESKYPSFQVKKTDVANIRFLEINQIKDSILFNKVLLSLDKNILNSNFINRTEVLSNSSRIDSLLSLTMNDSTKMKIQWLSEELDDNKRYFHDTNHIEYEKTNYENLNLSLPHIVIKKTKVDGYQPLNSFLENLAFKKRLNSSEESTILILDVKSEYVIYSNRLQGIDDYMSLSEMTNYCYFKKPETF